MSSNRKHATDEEIVAAVVATTTLTEAAAKCGVCEATIRRRKRDPQFRAMLGEASADLWRADADKWRREVPKSLEALVQLRDDVAQHPSTRARCAIAIVEIATKLHQLSDTDARIAAIEAQIAGEPKEADA